MISLTGKPIAITGASSGIGRATALACARAGMPVAVGARRTDKLDALVSEINAAGGRAVSLRMDVDNPNDCRALIDCTVDAFGSIYSVFANAGYGFHKSVAETTDDDFRAIFETNFYGTLNTIRPALPHLLAARSGHILLCSSCLAKLGAPFHAAYSATKAAQDHVARAMRVELKGTGVAVSSVHPIGTRTEFFALAEKRSVGERNSLPAPPNFFMQPAERVASAVVRRLRSGRGGETWTSLPARLAFVAADLFPSLTDWALGRFTPRHEPAAE